MDFTYTEEQEQLRSTLFSALRRNYSFAQRQDIVASDAGWSPAVWDQLTELGLTAIPFSEEVGGLDGSIVDLVAVAEIFGGYLVAEPWIPSTVLAGGLLAAFSDVAEARSLLEQVAAGEIIGALAHEEGRGTPDPALITMEAERTGEEYTLTGEKRMVLHGAAADIVLVTARLEGELALFSVDGNAPAATTFTTIDGRPAAHLRFEATPVKLIASSAEARVREVLNRAIIVLAAETVGAMGALLEQTVEYAHTRQQFGSPIGTFQVIAHRMADMKLAYAKSRATLLHTTAVAEAGQPSAHDIAVLKSQVGRLGRSVGEAAIQNHGGVGMTDELPIGHLHKRILTIDALLGSADYHACALGAPRAAKADGSARDMTPPSTTEKELFHADI
ncbi:MAG TPA: acyl-CoA dehydrogenase family protein [Enteractinococcus sp.]